MKLAASKARRKKKFFTFEALEILGCRGNTPESKYAGGASSGRDSATAEVRAK